MSNCCVSCPLIKRLPDLASPLVFPDAEPALRAYLARIRLNDVEIAVLSMPATRLKLLFICSRNQWRSPTAENVWRRHPQVLARSAGTSPSARHTVSEDDLLWADVVFVMEEKHKSRLVASFRDVMQGKPVHVLDIPDDYQYMDAALVEELQRSVADILGF